MIAVGGETRVAGVVGAPVSHSLSPVIHNAWIAAAGLDAVYVPFPVAPGRLAAFVEGLRGGTVLGVNVTAPFKGDALALADQASPAARRAGSANLLCFDTAGAVVADSTDGEGLTAALRSVAPVEIAAGGVVAILGAGGAARAAAAWAVDRGAQEARILARSPEKAHVAAAELGRRASPGNLDDAEAFLGDAALLINATPPGAVDEILAGRVASCLPRSAAVVDMVYRPLTTSLLAAAAARGLVVVDGLTMLVGQARPSFVRLFGAPPPTIDVRGAALAAMARPGRG